MFALEKMEILNPPIQYEQPCKDTVNMLVFLISPLINYDICVRQC